MNNERTVNALLKGAALATLLFAAYLAIRYSAQPLLELFGFRQTQTALTSFWFVKEGFKLAYETPVVGAPWSIPFEFPLYQAIVALIVKLTGADIGQTGRILSFVCLVLCLVPARSICRSLQLPPRTFYIFTALLFSSPLYLFWGRSFMIETLALLFAVASIKYFLDFLASARLRDAILFTGLMLLSILQKATTGLPVLAVLALVFLFHEIRTKKAFSQVVSFRNASYCALLFALPIIIGYAWAHYTDVVKTHNEFGTGLTSQNLSHWNWGTFEQRISAKLYVEVLWSRMINANLSGIFGAAILAYGILFAEERKTRAVISTACVLGVLPLFIFTNLHLVHTYYQSANVIFLIFGLAVAVSTIGSGHPRTLMLALFGALVAHNLYVFYVGYRLNLTQQIGIQNSRELVVSEVLKANMREGDAFTLFGHDWNSSITYYAEHKSFAVPDRFYNLTKVVENPESYLGGVPFGATAVCPEVSQPTLADLLRVKPEWKTAEVMGCYISVPAKAIAEKPAAPTQCIGSLDSAGDTYQKTPGIIEVKGWTVVDVEHDVMPDQVYVTLTDDKGNVRYYDTLQYPHTGVNAHFNNRDWTQAGFGRVIDTRAMSGHYTVGVIRSFNDQVQACQFKKEIQVEPQ